MAEARSQLQPRLGAGNPEAENEKAEAASNSFDDTILSPKLSRNKSSGLDAALELINEAGDLSTTPLDPAQQKRLVRRIDYHIMPLICVVYFLQYIDKTSISYASVTGIQEATGLVGNQFNWVASIFFFGQLAFEFPTIRLIQLFPLAKYASINVFIWGAVLACIAACKNYASLLVCRFLLGVFEAAVVPAWVLFTSQWYTKKEQAFQVGSGSPSAEQPRCLVDFSPTVSPNMLILPPRQGSCHWRTRKPTSSEFEATGRGIGSDKFKWSQVKEALTDSMTWLYCFWIFAANVPNSTATSFGNLLVEGMGYSSQESLILVTPLGAYEIVALSGLTWLAMKTRQRILWCIAGHIPAIIGAILMATTSKVPALIGYY
ncbi:hypothetical protein J3459_010944 [Metarhizium acridum]|nr:hypothetical protein J3459_010944 [Metarhizium acridum]